MSRLIASSVLVIVVAAALCAAQPAYPTIPTSYTALVTAAIEDKNYQLGYREWFDAGKNILRTQGRFSSPDTIEVVNWTNMSFYRFNSTTCIQYQNVTGPTLQMLRGSMSFFADVTGTRNYTGTLIARNTVCNAWQWKMRNPTMNYTAMVDMQIDYLFSSVTNLPFRVILRRNYTNILTDEPLRYVEHYYDWTSVVVGTPTIDVGALPAICNNAAIMPFGNAVPGTTYTVAPLPSDFSQVTVPAIPPQFRVLLEAKLGASSLNPTLAPLDWNVDLVDPVPKERVDCTDVNSCAIEAPTVIVHYFPSKAQAYKWAIAANGQCSLTVSSWRVGDSLAASPLTTVRAGTIPSMVATTFSASRSYQGREYQRGVLADRFATVDPVVRTNGGKRFTFQSLLYFFASGWGFPGRGDPLGAGLQVPLRINNTGVQVDLATQVTSHYEDQYDFFYFLAAPPTATNPTVFSPGQYGCPMELTPAATPQEDPYDTRWVVALIIIIVLVIVGIVGYCCYRRYRDNKGKFAFGGSAGGSSSRSEAELGVR